jgi:Family of unknown function (DUF5317)
MIGLLLPTLLALVGGLFARGSVTRLVRARMEWWWVVVGAFGVELVLYNPPVNTQAWALSIGPWLWVATKLAMLAALVRNSRADRASRWLWLIMGVGVGLNTLVIVVNGGHMPQSVEAAAAVWGPQHVGPGAFPGRLQNVAVLGPESRLTWLADVIAEPSWLPRPNVLSVGDVLLAFGMAGWVFGATRRRANPESVRSVLAEPPMRLFPLAS